MSLVFVRRMKYITTRQEKKGNPEKKPDQLHTISFGQHSGSVMKEGLFCTFILYKWRGWIEAGHSNQTCVRGRVMTCNMSPCQPQLTEQLPLGPEPSVPGVTLASHLITRL